MPEARGVLCDFDGTLADTRAANRAAYATAFARTGTDFPTEDYDAHFGLAFHDLMASVAPGVPSGTADRIAKIKTQVYPSYFGLVTVNAALAALLDRLRTDGVPLALATTARRASLAPLLLHLGLGRLFSAVVTAEDVVRTKPAPDVYLLAAQLIDRRPEDCIAFEDSSHGVQAAEAAGCLVMKVAL